ncbi:MAG: hypothetical protein AABX65_02185 [Nanoarchaeota archaeon]
MFWFLISLIIPVKGSVEKETKKADKCVLLTKNRQEVEIVLKAVKNNNWKVYHAIFRNCFHWRDEVLRRAGVRF